MKTNAQIAALIPALRLMRARGDTVPQDCKDITKEQAEQLLQQGLIEPSELRSTGAAAWTLTDAGYEVTARIERSEEALVEDRLRERVRVLEKALGEAATMVLDAALTIDNLTDGDGCDDGEAIEDARSRVAEWRALIAAGQTPAPAEAP